MGNGAKLALVGVLALIVLVVAVWDRKNEEAHADGLKGTPMAPLDPSKPGPKVKVVMSRPAGEDRMTGQITQGPLLTQGTLAAGKTPIHRAETPAAPAVAERAPVPSPVETFTRGSVVVEAPRPSVKKHTLKVGDTLAAIALREYGSRGAWKRIVDANKDVIKNPDRLPIGKEIVIPPAEAVQASTTTPAATVVKPALSHTTEVTTLPATTPASGPKKYVVEKGDTLAKIALKLLGSKDRWKAIQDANKDKLPNESSLKVGQELVIPAK